MASASKDQSSSETGTLRRWWARNPRGVIGLGFGFAAVLLVALALALLTVAHVLGRPLLPWNVVWGLLSPVWLIVLLVSALAMTLAGVGLKRAGRVHGPLTGGTLGALLAIAALGVYLLGTLSSLFTLALSASIVPAPVPRTAEFPTLPDGPDPDIRGTVSFAASDGERDCIYTVAASGGLAKEVACTRVESSTTDFLAWTKGGKLVATRAVVVDFQDLGWGSSAHGIEYKRDLLDPETGQILRSVPVSHKSVAPGRDPPRSWTIRADGSKLLVGSDGNRAWVAVRSPEGATQRILDVEGNSLSLPGYSFGGAQWSPDGKWILVPDTAGRLLIIGDDGTPGARVLDERDLRHRSPQAWNVPGNDTYTVKPPE